MGKVLYHHCFNTLDLYKITVIKKCKMKFKVLIIWNCSIVYFINYSEFLEKAAKVELWLKWKATFTCKRKPYTQVCNTCVCIDSTSWPSNLHWNSIILDLHRSTLRIIDRKMFREEPSGLNSLVVWRIKSRVTACVMLMCLSLMLYWMRLSHF